MHDATRNDLSQWVLGIPLCHSSQVDDRLLGGFVPPEVRKGSTFTIQNCELLAQKWLIIIVLRTAKPLGPGIPLCQPPWSGKALLGGLVPPVCQPKKLNWPIFKDICWDWHRPLGSKNWCFLMFSFPLCKEVSPRSSDQALLGRSHQPVARSGYRPRTLGYRHCWAG